MKKLFLLILTVVLFYGCTDDTYSCNNENGQITALSLFSFLDDDYVAELISEKLKEYTVLEAQTLRIDDSAKFSICQIDYKLKDNSYEKLSKTRSVLQLMVNLPFAGLEKRQLATENIEKIDQYFENELKKEDPNEIKRIEKALLNNPNKTILRFNYKIYDNGKGESIVEVQR